MKNLLVVGHSHIYALMKAYDGPAKTWRQDKFRCTFVELLAPNLLPTRIKAPAGGKELNPEILAAFSPDGGPFDLAVSCIGGNNHNMFGLLESAIPYDFVLPDAPEFPVQKGRMPMPAKIVRARLASNMAEVLDELALVRKAFGEIPAIHLESPPTIPSADHIRRHPGYFKDALVKHDVAPASFRYKLWRLQSAILGQKCEELGMPFHPVPKESQDDQGMMLEPYWNPDPSHGNADYGALVLRSLWEHVNGR